MDGAEYKVVPAPRRGLRKGARTAEERHALAIEGEIRRLAAEGWEYLRSDTFPCDERQGWWGKGTTVYRTVMVFRRPALAAQAVEPVAAAPVAAPAPVAAEEPRWSPPPRAARVAPPAPAPAPVAVPVPPAAPVPTPRAERPVADPRLRAREVPLPPRRGAPPVAPSVAPSVASPAPPVAAPAVPGWADDAQATWSDPLAEPAPPARR